jgi:Zn-dependent M28 family amino/carboxypeptidase
MNHHLKRRVVGVALLFCLGLASCASAPPDTLEGSLDLINKRALKRHVAWLAHDDRQGRMPGEAGYDRAAEYVAEQLASMGVEPAGVDGWYQPVSLRSYKANGEASTFIIHTAEGDEALVYREAFSVQPDPVRVSTQVRAEVVYVGFGVHAPDLGYSDYDGIDVSGKIVALYGGAPAALDGEKRAFYASSSTKRAELVSRGAIGTISLRSRKSEKDSPWEEVKKRIGRRASMTWVNSAGEASGHFPEIRGRAYVSPQTAEKLFANSSLSYEESLDAMEAGTVASVGLGVEVTIAGESTHDALTSPNVVGVVRGTDPELADEYVVYTAHLDHLGVRDEDGKQLIFNGTYDNAMGVALMLETARAMAAVPPPRSVLFVAVTAEEKGLLGSEFFVDEPTVPRGAIVANINLDMPLFLYPVADLVAFGSENSTLESVVRTAANAEGFSLSPDPIPEQNLFVRSDQYSFVQKGVPAIYLIPGFTSLDDDVDGEAAYRDHIKNHYHEPSDDLSRPVDWGSALRFARAHTRMGYAIATDATRPAWLEGNFFGTRFATP